MNLDDVLFGLIICGIGLAGACFRSEYLLLRQLRLTERRYQRAIRELHVQRVSSQAGDDSEEMARSPLSRSHGRAPARPIVSENRLNPGLAAYCGPDRRHELDATDDQ
jgi:hypothetical protein